MLLPSAYWYALLTVAANTKNIIKMLQADYCPLTHVAVDVAVARWLP